MQRLSCGVRSSEERTRERGGGSEARVDVTHRNLPSRGWSANSSSRQAGKQNKERLGGGREEEQARGARRAPNKAFRKLS